MTPEQLALLSKAKDSLTAARLLLENQLYDFPVSRSYYTMFYVAEALLLGEGLNFSKHSAVIVAFGKHFSKTARVPGHFHRYLIEGQENRVTGDYRSAPTFTAEDAEKQIQRAESFIEVGEKLLNPSE